MTTTINGRTPEEIKKGMHCIAWDEEDCSECIYMLPEYENCVQSAAADCLALVRQLQRERDEARKESATIRAANTVLCETLDVVRHERDELLQENQQLERERDAAVEELRGVCFNCAHRPDKSYIPCDKIKSCIHVNYGMEDAVDEWQWRGPQGTQKGADHEGHTDHQPAGGPADPQGGKS